MSAPTTPAEMADWLEANIIASHYLPPSQAEREAFARIVSFLRAQPTDAQKMEALKLATKAGAYLDRGEKTDAKRFAADAVRLLGLPTQE